MESEKCDKINWQLMTVIKCNSPHKIPVSDAFPTKWTEYSKENKSENPWANIFNDIPFRKTERLIIFPGIKDVDPTAF